MYIFKMGFEIGESESDAKRKKVKLIVMQKGKK